MCVSACVNVRMEILSFVSRSTDSRSSRSWRSRESLTGPPGSYGPQWRPKEPQQLRINKLVRYRKRSESEVRRNLWKAIQDIIYCDGFPNPFFPRDRSGLCAMVHPPFRTAAAATPMSKKSRLHFSRANEANRGCGRRARCKETSLKRNSDVTI